ncbi:MAG: hypothetical protein AUK48_15110 [Oscillatoriales cyanobacterium CG2_30_44_21]|nr:MAG: hypothetical protein AUK48_15110 [Oscillatoriales cyanobacterium CG2_30_44_21]
MAIEFAATFYIINALTLDITQLRHAKITIIAYVVNITALCALRGNQYLQRFAFNPKPSKILKEL